MKHLECRNITTKSFSYESIFHSPKISPLIFFRNHTSSSMGEKTEDSFLLATFPRTRQSMSRRNTMIPASLSFPDIYSNISKKVFKNMKTLKRRFEAHDT